MAWTRRISKGRAAVVAVVLALIVADDVICALDVDEGGCQL